jgi:hypothetical protein
VRAGRDANAVPLPAIVNLYVTKRYGAEELKLIGRLMRVEAVPDAWKDYFRKRADEAAG